MTNTTVALSGEESVGGSLAPLGDVDVPDFLRSLRVTCNRAP